MTEKQRVRWFARICDGNREGFGFGCYYCCSPEMLEGRFIGLDVRGHSEL